MKENLTTKERKDLSKAWLNKFYPRKAKDMKTATDKECFEHTLLKYSGTLPQVQKEFQIRVSGASVHEKDSNIDSFLFKELIYFAGDTCSLCSKYYNARKRKEEDSCSDCPLEIIGKGCITKKRSPYDSFCEHNNPRPMIKAMALLISQCDAEGTWINSNEVK